MKKEFNIKDGKIYTKSDLCERIDIFEIVLACAVHGEKMSVSGTALLGHRDHPSAGKVCAGKRIGVCRYLLGSARGDHIAAVERIRKACADAGKLCIMFCGSGEQAAGYFRQGFPNVAVGIDVLTLIAGTKAMVDTAKAGL